MINLHWIYQWMLKYSTAYFCDQWLKRMTTIFKLFPHDNHSLFIPTTFRASYANPFLTPLVQWKQPVYLVFVVLPVSRWECLTQINLRFNVLALHLCYWSCTPCRQESRKVAFSGESHTKVQTCSYNYYRHSGLIYVFFLFKITKH